MAKDFTSMEHIVVATRRSGATSLNLRLHQKNGGVKNE
jgi:hypothetical protein